MATLSADTSELVGIFRSAAYACFTPAGVPKINSYYGNNSILRLTGSAADPVSLFTDPPTGTNLTGFSRSIFSL